MTQSLPSRKSTRLWSTSPPRKIAKLLLFRLVLWSTKTFAKSHFNRFWVISKENWATPNQSYKKCAESKWHILTATLQLIHSNGKWMRTSPQSSFTPGFMGLRRLKPPRRMKQARCWDVHQLHLKKRFWYRPIWHLSKFVYTKIKMALFSLDYSFKGPKSLVSPDFSAIQAIGRNLNWILTKNS